MFVPGTTIKKPFCKLVGSDGNAYSIMARVSRALRKAGVSNEIVDEYMRRSTSGDYNNLLYVTTEYVNDEDEDDEDDDG